MRAEGALGANRSGHIICPKSRRRRWAGGGVKVIEVMLARGNPCRVAPGVNKYRATAALVVREKKPVETLPVSATIARGKRTGGKGRVLGALFGTEAKLRLLVEDHRSIVQAAMRRCRKGGRGVERVVWIYPGEAAPLRVHPTAGRRGFQPPFPSHDCAKG